MNNWYVKNLGDANFADESLDRIKALFLEEYEKADRPNDMAVFFRHESEGRLHCEVKVYFSPKANVLAKNFDALPCSKPSFYGLAILAGSKNALSTLFSRNSQ
ncbi:MAG: hypothetical protein DWQ05_17960 [Calditrichaeota bacterium]|nr:MAG: hypothetical protein DWQ05_17960 [Calditrichota bacterium]